MAVAHRWIACALAGAVALACGGRELGEMADEDCGVLVEPLPDVHVAAGDVVDLPLPVDPGPESLWFRFAASGVPDLNGILAMRKGDDGAGVLTISPEEQHVGTFELTIYVDGTQCESVVTVVVEAPE